MREAAKDDLEETLTIEYLSPDHVQLILSKMGLFLAVVTTAGMSEFGDSCIKACANGAVK